jgi:hypothetical protein
MPPNGLSLPLSYVAEHLSDGQAVSAILAILKSIGAGAAVPDGLFLLGGLRAANDHLSPETELKLADWPVVHQALRIVCPDL